MIDEEEYKNLRRKATDALSARDRAQGKFEAATGRLKAEFGCASLKAAEKLLTELDAAAEEAEAAYNTARDDFNAKWAAPETGADEE
jgi:hypothetical protein